MRSLFILLAVLSLSPSWVLGSTSARARAEDKESELEGQGPEFLASVEVSGRLSTGGARLARDQVASVEVHLGEDIRAAHARSLPEYLAALPGVVPEDQVGNGRQLSIDLRGFTSAAGTGSTALVVDGVRLNDPDTGLASFWLLRPGDIERVEIRKGPLGQLYGGGALAGAIHVMSRRGGSDSRVELRSRTGSHGLLGLELFAAAKVGKARLLATAGHDSGSGFRVGAGFEETAGRVELSRDLQEFSLAFSVSHLNGRWRQPGVLTEAEFEADRWQSGSNELDFSATRRSLFTLSARGKPGSRNDWSAVLSFRDRQQELLTTGREPFMAEPSCFGFYTEDRLQSYTFTAEGLARPLERRPEALEFRWGVDLTRDRLHPVSFFTGNLCEGASPTEGVLSADVRNSRDTRAAFGGLTARLGRQAIEWGFRFDSSTLRHHGTESDFGLFVAVDDERSFSDFSWGLGLMRSFEQGAVSGELRLAWATSFLAPNAIQLFPLPGFAPPDDLPPLQAQTGSGGTLGLELRGSNWDFGVELFGTDVDDEIVFDTEIVANVNANNTRRVGVELHGSKALGRHVAVQAGAVLTRATFRSGFQGSKKGDRIPLIPARRLNLGLEFGPFHGVRLGLAYRHVGASPLGNDFDNSSPEHEAHDLLGLSLSRVMLLPKGSLDLGLSLTNVLDEAYSVRGLEDRRATFLTPGPPLSLTLELAWAFP